MKTIQTIKTKKKIGTASAISGKVKYEFSLPVESSLEFIGQNRLTFKYITQPFGKKAITQGN